MIFLAELAFKSDRLLEMCSIGFPESSGRDVGEVTTHISSSAPC